MRSYAQQDLNIERHFMPQKGSHFGGLWEAAVKRIKYYLHRVVGNVHLTYEEMLTVLCQRHASVMPLSEACLNSRPLTPLSSDLSDLRALTPGHLTTVPLNSLPDQYLTDIKANRLNRWQHLQQLQQHFWKRWSSEYLAKLQQATTRTSRIPVHVTN